MTFLFDIGRVLLDFDFESSISTLFSADVTDQAERLERLLERKDEFEAGKIDVLTYVTWALEVLGCDVTHDQFCHAWQQIFVPNEPMWARVRQLAADGHRLILFSNINGIHWPWITQNFDGFELFHDAVLSFKAGFIKPDPGIYQHAISHHTLVPSETLYIDDLPQNCATGRELGFRTWQYDLKNHAAFETWLSSELSTSSV